MSSGGAPPPVAPTTSNPGLSALARGALPGGAAGALDVVLSQRNNPLAVLPAAMEVRLEEKDKPDPDFMTKYRTFLKEEYNVDLDLTLGWKTPTVGAQKLDLAKLYHEVTMRNGHKEVTITKQWKRVADAFKLPKSLTSASFLMRTHYERFLLDFEARNFGRQRDQGPVVPSNSGRANSRSILAGQSIPSGSHHIYPAAAHHMPHAHQYQHLLPAGVSFAATQAQAAAHQHPSNPTMLPPMVAQHVPPTATASQIAYNQTVPTMSDAFRTTGFHNVCVDPSSNNGVGEPARMVNMEGNEGVTVAGGPPPAISYLNENQLHQLILQVAHQQALRALEPIAKKLEDRLNHVERKTAQLEALGKRIHDHERKGGNRQASEEGSENEQRAPSSNSEGAGSQHNEDAQPRVKKVTLVGRKDRGGGGFAPYDKAGHNGSKVRCAPVNGEVNTATTKTALGVVEASQDKKRTWYEAIGAMAVGGANVAQLPPADTPATE